MLLTLMINQGYENHGNTLDGNGLEKTNYEAYSEDRDRIVTVTDLAS